MLTPAVKAPPDVGTVVVSSRWLMVSWLGLAVVTGLGTAVLIWRHWLSNGVNIAAFLICCCLIWAFFNQSQVTRRWWWYVPVSWLFAVSYVFYDAAQ